MRWCLLVMLALVGGCRDSQDTFVVEDPHALVRSATLSVCGSDTAMERRGDGFATARTIRCEGDGRIRLVLKDGRSVDCPIGYVSVGTELHWRFRVGTNGCHYVHNEAESAS